MDDRGDFEDIDRGLIVEIDKTLTPDGKVAFDFAEVDFLQAAERPGSVKPACGGSRS
jgi:alkyl sulfatase BDS1-like metallo-beta-lactamase superfamily hydrolase